MSPLVHWLTHILHGCAHATHQHTMSTACIIYIYINNIHCVYLRFEFTRRIHWFVIHKYLKAFVTFLDGRGRGHNNGSNDEILR